MKSWTTCPVVSHFQTCQKPEIPLAIKTHYFLFPASHLNDWPWTKGPFFLFTPVCLIFIPFASLGSSCPKFSWLDLTLFLCFSTSYLLPHTVAISNIHFIILFLLVATVNFAGALPVSTHVKSSFTMPTFISVLLSGLFSLQARNLLICQGQHIWLDLKEQNKSTMLIDMLELRWEGNRMLKAYEISQAAYLCCLILVWTQQNGIFSSSPQLKFTITSSITICVKLLKVRFLDLRDNLLSNPTPFDLKRLSRKFTKLPNFLNLVDRSQWLQCRNRGFIGGTNKNKSDSDLFGLTL